MKTILNRKLILLTALFLCGSIRVLFPQYYDLKFDHYTVLDGLSMSYIHCIHNDKKGFMWFGTDKGLNRYDGFTFHPYFADPDDPYSLNGDNISQIFEDSKGRMWVSSSSKEGGFHLYNRAQDNFIRLLPDPDLVTDPEQNIIGSMVQDSSGTLWLGTRKGILLFNPDQKIKAFTPLKLLTRSSTNVLDQMVGSLHIDSENIVWFGSSQGLYAYDPVIDSFYHFVHSAMDPNSLGDNRIQTIAEDHNGTIWVGTREGGLNKMIFPESGREDLGNIRFARYKNVPSDPYSISNDVINVITVDPSGTLWVGTDEGLNRMIIEKDSLHQFKSKERFIQYKTNPLDPESLNYNFVRCIHFDKMGTLWVGTSTGLNKIKNNKFLHIKQTGFDNSLASSKVQAFHEDGNGNIWIGSSKGLNLYNPQDNTFELKMSGAILSVSQDQQGDLWVGQWHKGLTRYNPQTGEMHHFRHNDLDPGSLGGDNVFTTYVDRDNDVWICNWEGGLCLYNRETGDFKRFTSKINDSNSLPSNNISTILEDSRGNYWIGTLEGLVLMKEKNKDSFTTFTHDPSDPLSITNNFILCLFESENGTIWIGTTAGLNKWDPLHSNFVTYLRSNGLPDDAIMGILEDDHGNLWISTSNGVFKIIFGKIEESNSQHISGGDVSIISSSTANDPDRHYIKSYGVDDGLQSQEFIARSVLRSHSGEMYMGGINGFNVFHPDSIRDNLYAPKVVITGLQLFNKPVSIGEVIHGDTILNHAISETDEIILSHKNNVFSLEFAALHFVSPEQNKYAYIMDGFEENWNLADAGQKATYTNLNHGKYVFRVKASNNDGIWCNEPTSLNIIVKPPFWKTWVFKVSFILVVLVLTLTVIELRIHTVKAQRDLLEQKVEKRTNQIFKQKEQIELQASKIQEMNKVLKAHNIELEDDILQLSKERVMQKLITFDEFKKIYPDETSCILFLEELKWSQGYQCKKCDHHEFSKEKETLMRRCKKCNYKESVTSSTIFHRLRFPINKAFYILILTSSGREINISQLSETIHLRMKTCWEFHNKVKGIMQTRKRFKNPKEGWKELILLQVINSK